MFHVIISRARPLCLACGRALVTRRGMPVLAEQFRSLGALCLCCYVGGPEEAAKQLRTLAQWCVDLAGRLEAAQKGADLQWPVFSMKRERKPARDNGGKPVWPSWERPQATERQHEE